jgi:hypothetical protein
MPFRRLVTIVALGALAVGAGTFVTRAAGPAPADQEAPADLVPVVGHAAAFGVTPAVRDLPAAVVPMKASGKTREIARFRQARRGAAPRGPSSGDAALVSPSVLGGMPAPTLTFEGLSNFDSGQVSGSFVIPPDANGDIGPNHYVQSVNLVSRVFFRNGTPASPPFLVSSLFAVLGGPCAVTDDGNPIVLYDHLANRWLISQFSFPDFPDPPYYQCVAVSQTPDPTGAYFAYAFAMPGNNLNDAPRFGVWHDAYYMTDIQFLAPAFDPNGSGAFAFDRTKMLAGDPTATFIYFDQSSDPLIIGQVPSDLDGPSAARPNIFAMFTATELGHPQGDGLRLWEFTPNFATPGSSTFTPLPALPVAAFDPVSPVGRADVPQPGTAIRLDSVDDRLMPRLQYRNFGAFESLVVNHTVDVSGNPAPATYRAGIRHYELRRTLPGGAWTVRDQGSFAPADTVNRWLGAAAMDNDGNLAVGYSVSDGTSVFPGIRYAGRLAGDPPGLAQGEATLQAGSGVQLGTTNRWGEYAGLSVDPLDDCTFWLTSEYYSSVNPGCVGSGAPICWRTRIGTFRFPSCTAAPLFGNLAGTVRNAVTTNPIAGALVTASGGYTTSTDATGAYSLNVPPGTYDVTASAVGYAPATVTGQVVVVGATTPVNFNLTPVAALVFESHAVDDSQGNGNGNVDPGECIGLTVTLRNAGAAGATGISATLSTTTPEVTVTTATSAYPNIAAGATGANTTPFRFDTTAAFPPGTPIAFTLTITTDQGPFTVNFTVPTGTINPVAVNFSATGPVPIPDEGAAMLPVAVSGLTQPIARVRVAVRLTHSFVSDLVLRLQGPDGTTVLLANQRGSDGQNYGTDCPTTDGDDTIFDDAAATGIGAGTAPFLGSFRPELPLSAFTGKSGPAANGTWNLLATDAAEFDTGNIECVTIIINGFLAGTGGGGCGPRLAVNDQTVAEGGANATFTVTLTPAAPGPVTVNYATADGTASAGADYTAASGTLTFATGETSKTVMVPILQDVLDESDETFNVNLSGATGPAAIGDAQGVGTITDDDPMPSIPIADLTLAEGSSGGTTLFTLPITLSAPSGRLVTLRFDTADGTAVAPGDYIATSANLTFQLGQTAIAANIDVVADKVDEADETFTVTLTNATNATLADGTAVATITDDDVSYYAVAPCRLHDTRQPPPGNPLQHNAIRDFSMTLACGVPADAAAVHVIVTTVAQSHSGDLRAWPTGETQPTSSVINYSALHNRANNAIIPVGTAGQVSVRAVLTSPTGTTHLVVDVLGYFK